jgi:multidrug resistance efflux pump
LIKNEKIGIMYTMSSNTELDQIKLQIEKIEEELKEEQTKAENTRGDWAIIENEYRRIQEIKTKLITLRYNRSLLE